MEGATRTDTYNVTVSIGGSPLGTWDVLEGGAIENELLTYRPGGLGEPVTLGTPSTTEEVTLRRLYRLGRDHAISQRFITWARNSAKVTISKQPLDQDGNAWGTPMVYNGKLRRVAFPNHDSNSNEAGLIEIVVAIDGFPTGMSPS